MPIQRPQNPLLEILYDEPAVAQQDSYTLDDVKDIQKEQEVRLLGTFLIQAIILALAILLYESWSWSQFSSSYEAAMFYGLVGFSLQASVYYVWRTIFEDSASYRRKLKRKRGRYKNKMAELKFEIEEKQLEALMESQIQRYKDTSGIALQDNQLSEAERQALASQWQQIQQTAQQHSNVDPATGGMHEEIDNLAQHLGVDRYRIAGIPMGPKLTVNPATQSIYNLSQHQQQEQDNLNLDPSKKN